MPWVKRVEAIIKALDGSCIGEIELAEGDMEFIIRRTPDVIVAVPSASAHGKQREQARLSDPANHIDIVAPLTGVYYSCPSPTLPPFVSVGDIIKVGQTIALIEAMKVFNEIQAEVAGRVVALPAEKGTVVKKGDILLKIEPL